eukprot:TRINITY_DN74299_c0_g1_i1.p1 TRINITY_DN74299_c0_g1~~TRINITY_DN74299_c0_g1_i1.p1  ORF type:complete len:266 (+),score=32.24 TRINITY_DN74299_c0_g1_i1:40-837(+)
MEIQGHRCYGDNEPHNSLRAARAAGLHPAVASVEFDVRLTLDGFVVVTHGPEGEDGKSLSATETMTLAEVQSVDIGRGERVPLLADLIDVCLEHGLIMNVELKDASEACIDKTLALLRHKNATDRCRISSFDRRALEMVLQKAPEIPIGALYHAGFFTPDGTYSRMPAPADFASWWERDRSKTPRADEDSVNLCAECINEELLAEVRRCGKRLMVWFPCVPTVAGFKEDAEFYKSLLGMGAAVVCCNNVDALAKVRDESVTWYVV